MEHWLGRFVDSRPEQQRWRRPQQLPWLPQPRDCGNDRKSRLALAFMALTYIQPGESSGDRLSKQGPAGARLGVPRPPPRTARQPGQAASRVLQSLARPASYLSRLWLLQCQSCLPSRQEGQVVLPRPAESRRQTSRLPGLRCRAGALALSLARSLALAASAPTGDAACRSWGARN